MTPDQVRSAYLDFFREHGHHVVASSPVVPEGDPTLLFTNAGMNQFKDVLLGLEKRDYVRAASVQKCIRAGGKHNDLDEVGKSPRHLTFFEMLGNWSFGEYYKKESIAWAWEFVTKVLGLAPERLFVSVFETDDESERLWKEDIGLSDAHVTRLGKEDNFWSMGPTGPCGPCTEIYYDVYPERGPADWTPGFDEHRFIEIWNLVFMESDAQEDGSLVPLPLQSVDTGMGLDRVAMILEGVDSVFKTGLFSPTFAKIEKLRTGTEVDLDALYASDDFMAYSVIADHVRTVLFSIVDGARFANEGRGYVLRRILRRAVRFGRQLGFEGPFLHEVAAAVVDNFQHVYPELRLKGREAATIICNEEERFFKTIDRGIALFEEVAARVEADSTRTIDGDAMFRLYDTFGFPPDLTQIMAEERGLSVDLEGYERAMQEQRERSKAADVRYESAGEWTILHDGAADTFIGYDKLAAVTDVLRFRVDGDAIELTLRESPFYAESGGQVGDRGQLLSEDGELEVSIDDTQKTTAGITLRGKVTRGAPSPERLAKPVSVQVDADARFLTACNHSATHLLHAALHEIVSADAFQAGSLVAPDRLRFDFSYGKPVTVEQLDAIERWVNARVRESLPIAIHADVPLEEAERRGAMMMFGEKYGAHVRMVEMGPDSLELCGGTHVAATSDIAYFRVTSESGVAAGVRRIEAVTNRGAFERAAADRARVRDLSALLKVNATQLDERVQRLLADNKELERKLTSLEQKQANEAASALGDALTKVGDVSVVAARVEAANRDQLLAMADGLRDQVDGPAVAFFAAAIDGKPALLVLCTDDAVSGHGLKAGDLINDAAQHVGGRGGGRPTLAQAGGKDVGGIDAAVASFVDAVRARLA